MADALNLVIGTPYVDTLTQAVRVFVRSAGGYLYFVTISDPRRRAFATRCCRAYRFRRLNDIESLAWASVEYRAGI